MIGCGVLFFAEYAEIKYTRILCGVNFSKRICTTEFIDAGIPTIKTHKLKIFNILITTTALANERSCYVIV